MLNFLKKLFRQIFSIFPHRGRLGSFSSPHRGRSGGGPNEKLFIKKIWSWRSKSQEQIYDILQIEVDYLLRVHTGYKLKGFSKPHYCHDRSIFYHIILKKK